MSNSTRSRSARKNRTRKPAQDERQVSLVGVKLEVAKATHDLLKRLAFDVDPEYTSDEIEDLARAYFEALDRGPGFGPKACGEIRELLCEAVRQSAGDQVTIPLTLMRRLASLLDRLVDFEGRYLDDKLAHLCEQALRQRDLDEAVERALAARDARAVVAVVAAPTELRIAPPPAAPCACETEVR